ncbi:MAG: efflux transporter outer membrane subunit [Desulfovibrio sp.]|jgi:multidrug efflux system outer membrane protein|nr:efflux transporter outer membrane subunit [Desulfovibrio sp.]
MSFFSLFARAAALACPCLALAACTLAPVYERPALPVPSSFNAGMAGSFAPLPEWQAFFKDPVLHRLIVLALQNNRNLRAVVENVDRVRAQYQIRRADILPTVSADGRSDNQSLPADLSGVGRRYIVRQQQAGVGVTNFELDLWGRLRSLSEAALETYYSAENDAASARLALISEVAAVCLQLVSDRELLDITRATYKNRKSQYDLVRNKFVAGVASKLEVSQAQGIMEEARSNVARYSTRVGQDENLLALLLGSPLPADLPEVRRLSGISSLADVPEGLPSSLLERRPDIQAAEHRLKATNANIGAARANFFPSIRLTSAFGSISADASRLFEGGAGFWSFMPSATLPLFDTGRNIAQLEVAEAELRIAAAEYDKTVQTAFREVADALVQRRYIGEQLDADGSLLKSAATTYNLASTRYEAGVDSYLNVLDAQRSLYAAQQGFIATRLQRENNALTLFKALGGGWTAPLATSASTR